MQDPKEVARFVFVLISVLDNLGSILPQVGAIMLVQQLLEMKEILLCTAPLNFTSFSFSQDNDQGILSHMPRDYAIAKNMGLILGVSLLQHVIINILIQPSCFPKNLLCALLCFMFFCKIAKNPPYPVESFLNQDCRPPVFTLPVNSVDAFFFF